MNRQLMLTAVVIVSTAFTARAQQSTSDKDVAELRSVAHQVIRGVEAGDVALIDSFLAPGYICVDIFGNAIDKAARLKQLKDAGIKFKEVESDDQSVRLHGDTRVITGVFDVHGDAIGRDLTGKYRYLDVWVKRDGKWVAIASTMTRIQPATTQPAK